MTDRLIEGEIGHFESFRFIPSYQHKEVWLKAFSFKGTVGVAPELPSIKGPEDYRRLAAAAAKRYRREQKRLLLAGKT